MGHYEVYDDHIVFIQDDDPHCQYCRRPAQRTRGRVLYPHRRELADNLFWVCHPCNAWVGTHPDGSPMGTLANADLRLARQRAHKAFDALWRDAGPMTRGQAYEWLAEALDVAPSDAHIGLLNEDDCHRVARLAILRTFEEMNNAF